MYKIVELVGVKVTKVARVKVAEIAMA